MKNLQVNLNYNYGYRWYSNNNIKVKGYIFDEKNFLYEKENLLNYFENINTEEEFKNAISNANGIFSVIIQKDKKIMFSVDKTRTFPLLYIDNENDLIISDDSYFLRENYKNDLDNVNSDEFLSIGFVMGE
jgi:asparagine synthase (glutamine-hydrolysing)